MHFPLASGQNGSMEQMSLKVVSRGDVLLEGVYSSEIHSTYSWYPVRLYFNIRVLHPVQEPGSYTENRTSTFSLLRGDRL